jgi:hypothetical protein
MAARLARAAVAAARQRRNDFDDLFFSVDTSRRHFSQNIKTGLTGHQIAGGADGSAFLLIEARCEENRRETKRAKTGKKGKKTLFALLARFCPFCFHLPIT